MKYYFKVNLTTRVGGLFKCSRNVIKRFIIVLKKQQHLNVKKGGKNSARERRHRHRVPMPHLPSTLPLSLGPAESL
jgi:hypothetical protein